ncbi:hypothetical protein PPH94_010865 [Burkholderia cepacia]|uniref:hypothetical protein n=1 Tax=Burkholderia cepacia TaxID=292 RepID=UPI00234A8893|nr:hypothetical protein [Burkholderia cepacia]MDC6102285.1 hypothetical protein [Burkholderia cepacia]
MGHIAILVDFDNCRNDRLERAMGRGNPSLADYKAVFDEMVGAVVSTLRTPGIRSEFSFRFYGGWFESVSGDPTDLHNMVVQCISGHRRQLNGQRLNFDIAYAPLFHGEMRFEATLRTEAWNRPEGKINDLATCMRAPGSHRCHAVLALNCWIRGKCPESDCHGRLRDVASRRGQKLVDTLLVADAVIAGSSGLYDQVVILSADEDLLPGLMFQSNRKCTMALARLNYSSSVGRYDQLLQLDGIEIHDL